MSVDRNDTNFLQSQLLVDRQDQYVVTGKCKLKYLIWEAAKNFKNNDIISTNK